VDELRLRARETVAFHFTFEQVPIERTLHAIESALAPYDYRAHLGKCHLEPGTYPRRADFEALAARLDPRGAFAQAV
jgi:alditol oxidase